MADPSTETWRAALGQSTSAQKKISDLTNALFDAREENTALTESLSIVERALRQLRRAFAASQQDLTAMQQQRDQARADNRRLTAELDSALRRLNELREVL